MKISSTKNLDSRLKFVVYGKSSVGKTTLASTIKEKVLIVSAESGLLCLKKFDIDCIEISKDEKGDLLPKEQRFTRLREVFKWLGKDPQLIHKYQWIYIDTLTEISQNLYEELVVRFPNPGDKLKIFEKLYYGMRGVIKGFRDLPFYHVVFSAHETIEKDKNGRLITRADILGKMGQTLPHFFDEVFYMEKLSDDKRQLVTVKDGLIAKDRSGMLDQFEPPCLNTVASKILNKKEKSKNDRPN